MQIKEDISRKRKSILLEKQITFSKDFMRKATKEINSYNLNHRIVNLKENLNKQANSLFDIKLKKSSINENNSKKNSIHEGYRNLLNKTGGNKLLEESKRIQEL